MYRAEALSTPEVRRLESMSRDALATLQKEFPFGVKRADGTLRLFWCTEKPGRATGEPWAGPAPSPRTSPRAG